MNITESILRKLCFKHSNCFSKNCYDKCKLYRCVFWEHFPLHERIIFFICLKITEFYDKLEENLEL